MHGGFAALTGDRGFRQGYFKVMVGRKSAAFGQIFSL